MDDFIPRLLIFKELSGKEDCLAIDVSRLKGPEVGDSLPLFLLDLRRSICLWCHFRGALLENNVADNKQCISWGRRQSISDELTVMKGHERTCVVEVTFRDFAPMSFYVWKEPYHIYVNSTAGREARKPFSGSGSVEVGVQDLDRSALMLVRWNMRTGQALGCTVQTASSRSLVISSQVQAQQTDSRIRLYFLLMIASRLLRASLRDAGRCSRCQGLRCLSQLQPCVPSTSTTSTLGLCMPHQSVANSSPFFVA